MSTVIALKFKDDNEYSRMIRRLTSYSSYINDFMSGCKKSLKKQKELDINDIHFDFIKIKNILSNKKKYSHIENFIDFRTISKVDDIVKLYKTKDYSVLDYKETKLKRENIYFNLIIDKKTNSFFIKFKNEVGKDLYYKTIFSFLFYSSDVSIIVKNNEDYETIGKTKTLMKKLKQLFE